MNRVFTDEHLADALNHDPLAAAEKITGERWGGGLVIEMHLRSVQAKRRLLEDADDTHFSSSFADYTRIIARIGFERVLHIPFIDERDSVVNSFQVWWDESRAILLHFDTYYGEKSVNGGRFHYNWLPQHGYEIRHDYETGQDIEQWGWIGGRFTCTSSGHCFEFGVDSEGRKMTGWSGYHDCREAVAFHIRKLEQNGEFIKPWRDFPSCMWLAHYMDWKKVEQSGILDRGNYVDKVSLERWMMLPRDVRESCGFDEKLFQRSHK